MTRSRSISFFFSLLAFLALIPAAAFGQGKSQSSPGHQNRAPRPGGGPAAPSPGNPSPSVASLASWLDDASTLKRGEAWLGLSVAHWSTDDVRVWFAPSMFVMAGLSDRFGLGASTSVYHLTDSTGASAHRLGDATFFGKIGLMRPERRKVGLALTPVVVVFDDPTTGGRSAAWALPVSVETRFRGGRLYGSGGYFSSRVGFVNGAAEFQLTPAIAVSGTLGTAFAGSDGETVLVSRHRTDVSVSLAAAAASNLVLSVSVGHSYSGEPSVDGGPWIAAGFALRPARR